MPIKTLSFKCLFTSLLPLSLLLNSCFLDDSLTIYPEDILYIYDGDTFFIECLPTFKCTDDKLGIRLLDVDTPEIKGRCPEEIKLAQQAKQLTVSILRSAESIHILPNDERLYDRYGRLLANIIIDQQYLSDQLINAGLGREYSGGYRHSWCQ